MLRFVTMRWPQCKAQVRSIYISALLNAGHRHPFRSGNVLEAGKYREKTFDGRTRVSGKQINPYKEGGNTLWPQLYGHWLQRSRQGPQATGYIDEEGNYVEVPEMIPEFIVPDLTGFELKPYVSYSCDVGDTPATTAETLFDHFYKPQLEAKYGQLSSEALSKEIERLSSASPTSTALTDLETEEPT